MRAAKPRRQHPLQGMVGERVADAQTDVGEGADGERHPVARQTGDQRRILEATYAVIDPLGRIINSLPLGAEGIFDSRLPAPVAPTFFVIAGDYALILSLVVSFIAIGRRRLRP